uniref:Uncharacterized protein n=1 Tax=Oryza punctata TaxID=4537 RepID=A0A0E0MK12_ORYPU
MKECLRCKECTPGMDSSVGSAERRIEEVPNEEGDVCDETSMKELPNQDDDGLRTALETGDGFEIQDDFGNEDEETEDEGVESQLAVPAVVYKRIYT